MADDSDKDSKTEDPTDKKIGDALEKGNTAFSKEITTASSVLALFVATWFLVPNIVMELSSSLRLLLSNISDWPMQTPEDASSVIILIFMEAGKIVLPLLLILMAFGFVASISQNMPRIVLDRIQPKMNRVSLPAGLKKLFGKQGVREFGKSIIKFSTAGLIAFLAFISRILSAIKS